MDSKNNDNTIVTFLKLLCSREMSRPGRGSFMEIQRSRCRVAWSGGKSIDIWEENIETWKNNEKYVHDYMNN